MQNLKVNFKNTHNQIVTKTFFFKQKGEKLCFLKKSSTTFAKLCETET